MGHIMMYNVTLTNDVLDTDVALDRLLLLTRILMWHTIFDDTWHTTCAKSVSTREAGLCRAQALGWSGRNFDQCDDSDGTDLDSSEMIGVRFFNQRGHRLNGTIMTAQGYTSRTFGRSMDDQTKGVGSSSKQITF